MQYAIEQQSDHVEHDLLRGVAARALGRSGGKARHIDRCRSTPAAGLVMLLQGGEQLGGLAARCVAAAGQRLLNQRAEIDIAPLADLADQRFQRRHAGKLRCRVGPGNLGRLIECGGQLPVNARQCRAHVALEKQHQNPPHARLGKRVPESLFQGREHLPRPEHLVAVRHADDRRQTGTNGTQGISGFDFGPTYRRRQRQRLVKIVAPQLARDGAFAALQRMPAAKQAVTETPIDRLATEPQLADRIEGNSPLGLRLAALRHLEQRVFEPGEHAREGALHPGKKAGAWPAEAVRVVIALDRSLDQVTGAHGRSRVDRSWAGIRNPSSGKAALPTRQIVAGNRHQLDAVQMIRGYRARPAHFAAQEELARNAADVDPQLDAHPRHQRLAEPQTKPAGGHIAGARWQGRTGQFGRTHRAHDLHQQALVAGSAPRGAAFIAGHGGLAARENRNAGSCHEEPTLIRCTVMGISDQRTETFKQKRKNLSARLRRFPCHDGMPHDRTRAGRRERRYRPPAVRAEARACAARVVCGNR
jgi:hypothetical protein